MLLVGRAPTAIPVMDESPLMHDDKSVSGVCLKKIVKAGAFVIHLQARQILPRLWHRYWCGGGRHRRGRQQLPHMRERPAADTGRPPVGHRHLPVR